MLPKNSCCKLIKFIVLRENKYIMVLNVICTLLLLVHTHHCSLWFFFFLGGDGFLQHLNFPVCLKMTQKLQVAQTLAPFPKMVKNPTEFYLYISTKLTVVVDKLCIRLYTLNYLSRNLQSSLCWFCSNFLNFILTIILYFMKCKTMETFWKPFFQFFFDNLMKIKI